MNRFEKIVDLERELVRLEKHKLKLENDNTLKTYEKEVLLSNLCKKINRTQTEINNLLGGGKYGRNS